MRAISNNILRQAQDELKLRQAQDKLKLRQAQDDSKMNHSELVELWNLKLISKGLHV
jgi:hypothetical protein